MGVNVNINNKAINATNGDIIVVVDQSNRIGE